MMWPFGKSEKEERSDRRQAQVEESTKIVFEAAKELREALAEKKIKSMSLVVEYANADKDD